MRTRPMTIGASRIEQLALQRSIHAHIFRSGIQSDGICRYGTIECFVAQDTLTQSVDHTQFDTSHLITDARKYYFPTFCYRNGFRDNGVFFRIVETGYHYIVARRPVLRSGQHSGQFYYPSFLRNSDHLFIDTTIVA